MAGNRGRGTVAGEVLPVTEGLRTEVLVIGGGATGAGIARDAALRGFATILVERGELACGTTGRFHGLLHSGARYVVSDPIAAHECARESQVLRATAAGYLGDTGGIAVLLPGDDANYAAAFLEGCAKAGVAVGEVDPSLALAQEPQLCATALRTFAVADGTLDARGLVAACASSAVLHGAQVLQGHAVVRLRLAGGTVQGADLLERATGQARRVTADVVVNAAGPWAGQVARLAGCRLPVKLSKGVMVAVTPAGAGTYGLTRVISRCRPPQDGDIIVPQGCGLVVGTTDAAVGDPDDCRVEDADIRGLMASGAQLLPALAQAGTLRAWAAIRPLAYQPPVTKAAAPELPEHGPPLGPGGRAVSRTHLLVDHALSDGVGGFLSIAGGKVTTYRLMAQDALDAVAAILGPRRPCTTQFEPLPNPPAS